ncbi:hypothetical protein BDA96_08G166600 [Sorghum bicolor]|uniref:Uncharacterized protein n=3 Tax=Sorghum bicolor TaxID=4558 RepID=A0A1B6PEB0_SORBI|nr:disease resistance protein RPM1 [Sorghum bicolor]KAG0521506.1 hypothetical protein BDA96_08G166600 [Sorghum bicolor]KXG23865.1 hypothetical protein SORBI_3008G150100 [Sorghum bicolor]|eukprot:XP_002443471.2 disease resistance protein RPM1 [Sorghum bicolor]
MEATALSLGKSVLDGALGYAKSALAEEVALQLGVQRDHAFIRELEMMRAFLRAAHDERGDHQVLMTWVKQVRDVAYDAEDILQDCLAHLKKPSWWRRPSTLPERRRIAKKMKELRARVEDVSQRNLRYQLVKSAGSKPEDGTEVAGAAAMSGMEEALRQQNKSKADLIRLVNKKDEELRVIGVWGTSDLLGEKSIVKRAYDGLKRDRKFQYHAWISMVRPLSTTAILQDIVMQFAVDSLEGENKKHISAPHEAQDLRRLWVAKEDDLADEFRKFLNEKSYLIVVNGLSTMDEWDQIRTCFPTNKKGSRLLVCTQHVKIASLCVEPSTLLLPEHKQLFPDKALYAFYDKGLQDPCSGDPGPSSTTNTPDDSGDGKYLTRMVTNVTAFKESKLIGRQSEKSQILKLMSNELSQDFEVITVWGMGGLGKTTLVKDVYQSLELNAMFDKRACVTVKRPFNHTEILNSLAEQLSSQKQWNPDILEGKKYLIVLDDLSTTKEWNDIQNHFPRMVAESRIIVTTRLNEIARHCSSKPTHIMELKILEEKDALDLFTEKVFGKITNLNEECPELYEVAELIMKKCKGLPLAIVTIGGFLAKQPKTPMEWKKLNSHISAELEMNQGLRNIKNVLNKSYDGLPYHLKPCFLYLSIFPEDQDIKRNRLVRRWIAEGYSTEVLGKPLIETAESHFMELVDRSMILPNKTTYFSKKVINSCQVHDLMREISISKAAEENLVFRLEEDCSSNTIGTARHLTISANWKGDEADFESMVDVSRIRSLTVFGKWRQFFISDKMRFLRVLDLQDTKGLCNHHLEHIGKLVHLRYLSLRGCLGIYHLPDSVGNMRQLQTLDIRLTWIAMLPKTIVKLKQLQYLRIGGLRTDRVYFLDRLKSKCVAFCSCHQPTYYDSDMEETWCDRCTKCWYVVMPGLATPSGSGTPVPRGVGNLKALRTLGVVDIGSGNAQIKEIKRLTQLHKLQVTGINKKNWQEFCSTLESLSCLESLSMSSSGLNGSLRCLSDAVFLPPNNLRTLMLLDDLGKMPAWIMHLRNLAKLRLMCTHLTDSDGTMQLLGNLPDLAILRVDSYTFEVEGLCLNFLPEAFPSLVALQLCSAHRRARGSEIKSVEFKEGTAPKLEVLRFTYRRDVVINDGLFSGLASLPGLKKFELGIHSFEGKEGFVEHVRAQLALNQNQPVLTKAW